MPAKLDVSFSSCSFHSRGASSSQMEHGRSDTAIFIAAHLSGSRLSSMVRNRNSSRPGRQGLGASPSGFHSDASATLLPSEPSSSSCRRRCCSAVAASTAASVAAAASSAGAPSAAACSASCVSRLRRRRCSGRSSGAAAAAVTASAASGSAAAVAVELVTACCCRHCCCSRCKSAPVAAAAAETPNAVDTAIGSSRLCFLRPSGHQPWSAGRPCCCQGCRV